MTLSLKVSGLFYVLNYYILFMLNLCFTSLNHIFVYCFISAIIYPNYGDYNEQIKLIIII